MLYSRTLFTFLILNESKRRFRLNISVCEYTSKYVCVYAYLHTCIYSKDKEYYDETLEHVKFPFVCYFGHEFNVTFVLFPQQTTLFTCQIPHTWWNLRNKWLSPFFYIASLFTSCHLYVWVLFLGTFFLKKKFD